MPLIVLGLAARDDDAGSWARSCGVRPSRRPLRCCSCSSWACWPPSLCSTTVAQQLQHCNAAHAAVLACADPSRAWTAPSRCPRPSPARSSCPASSASRLWRAGTTRHESFLAILHEQMGVLGLQIWPTGSARGERPPRDLPFGALRGSGGCADRRRRLRTARTSGASS